MPLKSFSPLYGRRILILTHAGCDVDALSSAAAIHFSLKGKARTIIGIPEHMNNSSAAFAKNLKLPFTVNPSLDGFDALLCVDFGRAVMAGSYGDKLDSFRGEKFLIDHHSARQDIAPQKNALVKSNAISTTEIVHDLLKASKVKIQSRAYLCIAAGIISDSSSFMVADHETFSIMAEVMRGAKASYAQIVSLFSVERDLSEKVACLKACRRCRIFRSGDAVVAVADIGAFEADAAGALVRVGAAIAFCGYSDKGSVRVSGRLNNAWAKRNGIGLAKDVFAPLAKELGGEGGGHAGAAGYNGKGESVEPALLKCVGLVNG